MQSSSRVEGLFGRKLVPGISDWMDCSWSGLIFHNSLDCIAAYKKLHSCQRVWWLKDGDFKSLCGLVTSRLRGSDSKIIFTRTLKSFNVQTPFWKKDLPVYDDEHVRVPEFHVARYHRFIFLLKHALPSINFFAEIFDSCNELLQNWGTARSRPEIIRNNFILLNVADIFNEIITRLVWCICSLFRGESCFFNREFKQRRQLRRGQLN